MIRRPQDGEDEESQEELTGPTEASQLLLPTWSRDREEQFPRLKELGEEYAHSPQDRKGKQVCARAELIWEAPLLAGFFLSAQPPTSRVLPPSISRSVSAISTFSWARKVAFWKHVLCLHGLGVFQILVI